MQLPTYAVVCLAMATLISLVCGKPGKMPTALIVVLILIAGGPTAYQEIYAKLVKDESPDMMGLK